MGHAQRAQRKFLIVGIVLDEENQLVLDGGSFETGEPSG